MRDFSESSGDGTFIRKIKSKIYDLASQDMGVRKKTSRDVTSLASTALGKNDATDDERRALIAQTGNMVDLVVLLRDNDTEVRQYAAEALSELAYDHVENQIVIPRAGGVIPLVSLLADKDTKVRKAAAGAVMNLAANDENQALIAEAGGVASLVALLSDSDTEVRQNAVFALANLALNDENQVLIAETGGVTSLVALLSDSDTEVRKNAVLALSELALNYEHQVLIAEAGGVAPLVALLSDSDTEVRKNGALALSELAANHANRFLVAEAGGIVSLVALLSDADGKVREKALRALRILAANDETQRLIVEAGGIEAVLVLLAGAGEENKFLVELLRDLGGIPFLVARLRDQDAMVRRTAAEALCTLSMTAQALLLITRALPPAGGIAPLVALLSDSDAEVRQSALLVLGNVAWSSRSRALISKEVGMMRLMALLSDQNAMVRAGAAWVLSILADNAQSRLLIGEAGGIASLVNLLSDQNAMVRGNAAGALRVLALNAENKGLIAEAEGIAPLVMLLRDQETEVRKKAVGALLELAYDHAENQMLIAKVRGVAPLLALQTDQDREIREIASEVLSDLASNHEIAQAGGLLRWCSSGKVRKQGAESLVNLPSSAEHEGLIACARGVSPSVTLLSDADTEVRQNAAAALADLDDNAENNVLIGCSEGVATWVALLNEPDVPTRRHTTNTLRRLINVSLWFQKNIVPVLEAQEKKEIDAEIKEDLRYILGHWQKQGEQAASHQDPLRLEQRLAAEALQIFSQELSWLSERPSQNIALPGMGGYAIKASEIEWGRCVGVGRFAEVYEATYQFQKVAVKKYVGVQLRPSERTKVATEIALMASFKHAYLVAVLGVIEEPFGMLSLVMEHPERGSLYEYLRAHRAIPWGWRLSVAEELARGLAYLHQKNFLHQDIKSLNVILDDGLHAKWCDFGLVSLKQQAHTVERDQDQIERIRWRAPELCEDGAAASKQADMWSYGMLLFELATQTVPYRGLKAPEIMARLMQHQAEEVPEACRQHVPQFAGLMEACWKRQEERPDASQVVEVLTQVR